MRCQACSGVQSRVVGSMSRMYILRISEADCSMISRTASVFWSEVGLMHLFFFLGAGGRLWI